MQRILVAQTELISAYWPRVNLPYRRWLHRLLPTPDNVIFALLLIALLLQAQTTRTQP